MNRFTLIIHNKGWSVKGACAHWNIHYDTYNARCNNPKMFNQLECMCNGLELKRDINDFEVSLFNSIAGSSSMPNRFKGA